METSPSIITGFALLVILSMIASQIGLSASGIGFIRSYQPSARYCVQKIIERSIRLTCSQTTDQPLIENQQIDLLVCIDDLSEISVCFCNVKFVQKLRHPDVAYRLELAAGSISERTRNVGLAVTGCAAVMLYLLPDSDL